ncbi:MAG: M56 family metallopeptidase [Pirellulaceae bacterium]
MNAQILDIVGWVLVHSLWQFTAIGCLAWILDSGGRRCSAVFRCNLLLGTLILTATCPIATALTMLRNPISVTANVPTEATSLNPTSNVAGSILAVPREIESPTDGEGSREDSIGAKNAGASFVGDDGWDHWLNAQSIATRFSQSIEPWLTIIVCFWGAGVLFFAARLAVGWGRVRGLLRESAKVDDEVLLSLLRGAASKLGIVRKLQLLVNTRIESPVVVGVLRSTIVIPTSFASGVSPELIEAIFAHELAHVRRFDYLINLVQSMIESLFFYHPMVWWLSRRIREERENCCDDLAAMAIQSRVAIGRALLAVEELRGQSLKPALGASGGSLLARVRRLLDKPIEPPTSNRSTSILIVGLLVSLVIGMTGVAMTQAATPEDDDNDKNAGYVIELERDLTVELIAVKPHHTEDVRRAWRPDGIPVDESLSLPVVPGNSRTRQLEGYDLFFQFKGLKETQTPTYSGDGLDTAWNPNEDGTASIILVPGNNALTASITVGIPDDEWGPWRSVDLEAQAAEFPKPSHFQRALFVFRSRDIQRHSDSSSFAGDMIATLKMWLGWKSLL